MGEFWAAEDTFLHVSQLDVLEAENLLRVVISDKGSIHSPDLALHYVLEEATADQVVELSLIGRVLTLVFHDFVVQVVYVIEDLVTEDGRGTSLKLEDNAVALCIDALSVDLRAEHKVPRLHVPEVVLFIAGSRS